VETPTESVTSSSISWLLVGAIAGAVVLIAIAVVVVLLFRRRSGPATPGPVGFSAPALPREAGWYPDPHGQSRLRWFDGRQWTPATQE
jgi:hypothetical protein